MPHEPSADTTSGGKQHFLPLDALRGVAALAVVGFHAYSLLGGNYVPRGYLAVDLFFLLSGVVIAHAYEERLRSGLGLRRFFIIRMVRFAPFYLLGTLFGIFQAALVLIMSDGTSSWAYLAADTVLGALFLPNLLHGLQSYMFPLNAPGWSLFYEIAVNLLYALFLPFLSNRVLVVIVLTSGAALGALALFVPEIYATNPGPFAADLPQGSLRVVFSFSFGVLIYRKREDWQLPTFPVLPVISLAIAPYFLPLALLGPAWDRLYVLVLSPLVIAALLKRSQRPMSATATRASLLLGTLSYGVYATHFPLVWISVGVQNRLPLPDMVMVFAYFVGLIVLVLLVDRFIDRPLRRALSRRLGL